MLSKQGTSSSPLGIRESNAYSGNDESTDDGSPSPSVFGRLKSPKNSTLPKQTLEESSCPVSPDTQLDILSQFNFGKPQISFVNTDQPFSSEQGKLGVGKRGLPRAKVARARRRRTLPSITEAQVELLLAQLPRGQCTKYDIAATFRVVDLRQILAYKLKRSFKSKGKKDLVSAEACLHSFLKASKTYFFWKRWMKCTTSFLAVKPFPQPLSHQG